MESLGSWLFIAIGIAAWALCASQEIKWRKRLAVGKKTEGRVVDIQHAGQDNGLKPEIEFDWNDTTHRFISEYSGTRCPPIGSAVEVLVNPDTLEAEHVSLGNRWLFSIIPLIAGIAFFSIGVASL